MNNKIWWNDGWQFTRNYTEEFLTSNDSEGIVEVRLPHTVAETPYNYFDEEIYQTISGYKKIFVPKDEWKNKKVILTIEAAGHSAIVYFNGIRIKEHNCGYTAFSVDLAEHIAWDKENVLVVRVDSREIQNIPPFGYVIDYMTYGGLYREVYLEIKEKNHIVDVFAKADDKFNLETEIEIEIDNAGLESGILTVKQEILDIEGKLISIVSEGTISSKNSKAIYKSNSTVDGVKLWDIKNPTLYILRTTLYNNGQPSDVREDRIGFRTAEFRKDGFYLNGKKIKLRGLNRHQSYAYVGYAMPKSMQEYDAEVLKNELKVNAVRTSHYPQSKHFINRCDELGLLVFTEIPGWQHIGDKDWQAQAIKNTEDMVKQYRNHPSIILWGVRINESLDNDELYKVTNEVAHKLDNSRQTSGVRYLQKSSLLEDVYAFNDFSHDGNTPGCKKKKDVTPDMNKGYLISEYNGHMYPTKSYDDEEHRVEHMLRHARVLDAVASNDDIAGSFGWCMFDYNTHKDFGSGDRICYHGVCDMFRNPKMAAAVYQSQQDEEIVLEVSSSMDIGEHPAGYIKDVYAMTNADSVIIYKNDEYVKEIFTKESEFKGLSHGPIKLDDFVGELMERNEGFSKAKSEDVKKILYAVAKYSVSNLPLSIKLLAAKCILMRGMTMDDAVRLYGKYIGNWGAGATVYTFAAIKDGKEAKVVTKKPVEAVLLDIKVSKTELVEDTSYDVAAVRFKAVGDTGEILNYCNQVISMETEGDIEIIGPKTVALSGGMSGTYIKTKGVSGIGKLIIDAGAFGKKTIEFNVNISA